MSSAGFQLVAGRIPGERIATTEATSDSSLFTTSEIEIMSVTADVVDGRTYQVRAEVALDSNNAGDEIRVQIREDNSSGSQMQDQRLPLPTSNRFYRTQLEAEYTADATESKTFSLTAVRLSGSGNCQFRAAGNAPGYLYVDYIRG